MIGVDAVPALAHELGTSTDATVRASAVKGLAAVALYFPAERATFPTAALDAMEAALTGSPDPVTKLATVGALGTLGSPTKGEDGAALPGNARAVAFLIRIADETADLGVAAVAVGALASIGASGEREAVLPALRALAEKEGGDGSWSLSARWRRRTRATWPAGRGRGGGRERREVEGGGGGAWGDGDGGRPCFCTPGRWGRPSRADRRRRLGRWRKVLRQRFLSRL
eukprot:TRINITY_DN3036_c0_g1_i1.p1 TRINITY_DN3036_c0_g1~~TRINITY_DN3036_c0_g1_i1.p1  ORF type:complete len:227 (-),score=56.83 TRINITY_DN3036_c0_g1_i1:38-718(-)